VVARVFVSHASKDLMLVHAWDQLLTDAGHDVFLACDLYHGITVGENWEQRLRHELAQTDAVVCAITSAYLESQVCSEEIKIAQSFARQLLPVQVESDVLHPLLKNIQHVGLDGLRVQLLNRLRQIDDRADDLKLKDPERACAEFGEAMNRIEKVKVENPLEKARAHEGIARCQIVDAIRSLDKAEGGYSDIRADQHHARVVRMRDELRGHAYG
jgi:hypothetical protein